VKQPQNGVADIHITVISHNVQDSQTLCRRELSTIEQETTKSVTPSVCLPLSSTSFVPKTALPEDSCLHQMASCYCFPYSNQLVMLRTISCF
jgi:hypothetical protein